MLLHMHAPDGPLDLGPALRDLRLYRAPWEPKIVEVLPLPRLINHPRPLARPPLRLSVRPNYWFGPFPDFLLTLGYFALGGGGSDPRQGGWTTEIAPDIGQPPPLIGYPVRWEYPPVILKVDPAPGPR